MVVEGLTDQNKARLFDLNVHFDFRFLLCFCSGSVFSFKLIWFLYCFTEFVHVIFILYFSVLLCRRGIKAYMFS